MDTADHKVPVSEDVQQPLEVEEVPTPSGKPIQIDERDLRVSGNVSSGGVIRGQGGVSIRGKVSGSSRQRCLIEVGGDIIVGDDVEFARIRCRSLKVEGNLEKAEVLSDRELELEGDLGEVEVQVGMWGRESSQLNGLSKKISHLESEVNGFEGRIRMASRRFFRDYGNIVLQFSNIITISNRRIQVDLKVIYRILHKLPDHDVEKVDKGIEDFFCKVIVGDLTRVNKAYISQNPSRQNTFLKLIRELREHFIDIRKRDNLLASIKKMEMLQEHLFDMIKAPTPWGVIVKGKIKPKTIIRLMQFGLKEGEEGGEKDSPKLERRTAQLRVESPDEDVLSLNLLSTEGASSVKDKVTQAELSAVRVSLHDALPVWNPI